MYHVMYIQDEYNKKNHVWAVWGPLDAIFGMAVPCCAFGFLDGLVQRQNENQSGSDHFFTLQQYSGIGEDIQSVSDKINFNEMTKSEKEMILLDLRKEMIELAEKLEFEKAAKLRDVIENIEKNIESVVI